MLSNDINKLQDINNIWVFYICSYFSAVTSMVLGGRPSFFWVYILISLIVFLGLIFFSQKKGIYLSLFFIIFVCGLFLVFTKPHIRHNFSIIFDISAFIFGILTIYSLFLFNNLTNIILKEKKDYIKEDLYGCTYNYAFTASFINIIVLILFLQNVLFHRHEIFLNMFIFSSISVMLFGLIIFKLYQYSFALRLLALSENKSIPTGSLFLENSNYNAGFSKYIYPYLNNVEYNESEKMIYINNGFSTTKEEKAVKNNEIDNKLLSKVKQIRKRVEEENTDLIRILIEIEGTINRLDNLYEEKQVRMYYKDIDTRYIPYIDKLVSMYIINLSMPDNINSDIQKKILDSLEDINKVLYNILESISSFKKIEIESSIEIINKRLMMDGFDSILKEDKKSE